MPKQILNEEQMRDVRVYLDEQLQLAYEERTDAMEKVQKWRRQREARPEHKSKNRPWKKASNVCVPLAAINTQGIFASLKSAFSVKKPFVTVETDRKESIKVAEALSNYLNTIVESRQGLNIREKNNEILYELASLGTEFVKVPWRTEVWSFKRENDLGEKEQVNETIHNGPDVIPLRIEDFITRGHFYDLQKATWIATRDRLAWHELVQLENRGVFEDIDRIKDFFESEPLEDVQIDMERRGFDPKTSEMYEIYEVHLYYDVDDDGILEDIVVFYHKDSETILRSEFNSLGVRPVVRIPYVEMPKALYGMGIGWMSEHLQDEVDALHNMRIDSTHISALQMFISKKGSAIANNESFYPMKNIQVDNPREDFMPVKFPDLGPSTLQAEMVAKEYASQFTGATDAMMGQPDTYAKTRSTATSYLFRAQQGNKLFSSIMTNVEYGFSEIFMMIVFQLVLNKDQVNVDILPPEEAQLMQLVLSMNVEDIRKNFIFKVRTTDIDETEEAKRMNLLTLMQLYTQYGQQVMGLTQYMYHPQMPPQVREIATKFFVGATKLMEKVMDHFDHQNYEDVLPYTRDLEMMLAMMADMKDKQIGGMLSGQQQQGNFPGAAPGGQMGAGPQAGPGPQGPGLGQ